MSNDLTGYIHRTHLLRYSLHPEMSAAGMWSECVCVRWLRGGAVLDSVALVLYKCLFFSQSIGKFSFQGFRGKLKEIS